MKVRVTVDLDIVMLDGSGANLPEPAPDTPEMAEILMAAREAIHSAVKRGEQDGFDHDWADFSSIQVGRVEAAAVPPSFVAHFQPQAWQDDMAVDVDDEGPDEWDCTAFLVGKGVEFVTRVWNEVEGGVEWLDVDDVLKDDPAAPAWVREWRGPFAITVRLPDDD